MPEDAFTGLLSPRPLTTLPSSPAATAPKPQPPASAEPQVAVRARLNAIVLDLVLLGLVSRVLLAVTGARASSGSVFALFTVLQLAYFFVYEASSGQTIGKRFFHVRVETLSGQRPTTRQIAWRTVLRPVDALPALYASGLISLMRTGRARRQRIGDVVGGTTVVLDDRGRPLPTPRWLLPAATILATAISVAILLAAFHARPRPIETATGFSGARSAAPTSGTWLAHATTLSSVGYSNVHAGDSYSKDWRIERSCVPSGICGFQLTLALAHEPAATAPLVERGDGWHADLPLRLYPCGVSEGRELYWPQHSSLVLRFDADGRTAEAHERDFSDAAGCGYGTDAVTWTAERR
jgi:uncharacterized RDD family membrane protein YckC